MIPQSEHKVKGKRDVKNFYNRRSNTKSRNGCGTCKIRKVKCDETKPICTRCQKAGLKCDGYLIPPPKRRIPKNISPASQRPVASPQSPIPSLQIENQTEAIYFSYFRTVVVPELSGSFDTGFWSRLVLQSSHNEPFILKTIIAISALRTSQKQPQSFIIAKQHVEFALHEYQKAVQMMTASLSKDASPRKALLMCLLVCCFEGLSGNTYTALSHARSGQKLLEEWLESRQYSKADEEGLASPASYEIEDDLVQAAGFFEQQICGLFDIREPAVFARRKRLGEQAIRSMPEKFGELGVARKYWTLIHRRNMNFIMDTVRNLAVPRPASSTPKSETDIQAARQAFFQERARYAVEVAHWRRAFHDLYEDIKSFGDGRMAIAAHTLYLQARMQEFIMIGLAESTPTENQNRTHWAELLSVSRTIINRQKSLSGPKFLFELGIIPALHMVAKYCDIYAFRVEAISLMRLYSTREGNWDSETIADIDQAFLDLQTENDRSGVSKGDDLPERAKGRLIKIVKGRGKRVDERYAGQIAGLRGGNEGDSKGDRREVKLNWIEVREWPGHVPRWYERSVAYEELDD